MELKESVAAFERIGAAGPPQWPARLVDTACVLGGSIAGLLAARVLADYANRVVVIEREAVGGKSRPRTGVPQGRHVHALLPGGLRVMERWLPGLTQEIEAGGGVIAYPEQSIEYLDSRAHVRTGDHTMLLASRPFLEAGIRRRILDLPNVSVFHSQATGLKYRGDEVTGVRYASGAGSGVLSADLVVDAMGRASKLLDWLAADGYDRPELERLPTGINYSTALFERNSGPQDLELTCAAARFGPPYPADGVAVAAVSAIEGGRWMALLVGYDETRPGRTPDAFRAACAKLPHPFPGIAGNALVEEIATYHQADSRRRHFSGARRFPARLVSVGDAVASFNPIYGQGMSSAALHAACLSEFLGSSPDLSAPAKGFFELQDIFVDAAWGISAGSDSARLDAASGADVPEEVRRQRQAIHDIIQATLVDVEVCRAFRNVTFMLSHPATLADPALVERAAAANSAVTH